MRNIFDNKVILPASTRRAFMIFLMLVFVCLAIPSILTNSVTIDEFTHIPVGYAQVWYQQYQLEPANPPLVRMIFGYPIHYYSPILYWGEHLATVDYISYGFYFLDMNSPLYHVMAVTSRFIVLGMSILLAYLVYRWTREEYGDLSAFLALTLCLFNPNILANGTLATLDAGLTLTWVVALYGFKKYLDRPTWSRTALMGVLLGIALCAKYTSLLLFILLPLILLVDPIVRSGFSKKKIVGQFLTMVLLSIVVINIVYNFNRSFTPMGSFTFKTPLCKGLQKILPSGFPSPVPYFYLSGVDLQLSETRKSSNYLNGEFTETGSWYYYLEAFIIKNPIPLFIFLGWSLFLLLRYRKSLTRSEWIWLLAASFLFMFFSFSRIKNIGLRYILPCFPFIFMLSSRFLTAELDRNKAVVFSALFLWYVGSCLYICPQYLAYYNEFIGGPHNGHKYLLDANTDWGQDNIRLKAYMTAHRLNKIWYTPSGPVHPNVYGIEFERIPPEPVTGVIAIGVDQLYGVFAPLPTMRGRYNWLKAYKPKEMVGYSILIYDIPAQM